MNPEYLGDSYDLVKRFFCRELSILGYSVVVDPMLTGTWGTNEQDFYRLIGANPVAPARLASARTAFFLDPDIGINESGSKQHASFDRLALEATRHDLVLAFDQSFSRQAKAKDVIQTKLWAFRSRGCHAMYYDSHARFVFVAKQRPVLDELQLQFLALGLPAWRLLTSDA